MSAPIPKPGDILPATDAMLSIPHMDLSSPIDIPEISSDAYATNISPARRSYLQYEIARLKKDTGALILAHNYMPDDVQMVADVVGDSLALAKAGRDSDAPIVLEASVLFMNQILAVFLEVFQKKNQTILAPSMSALCSLAAHANPKKIRAWKRKFPDGIVISYVNTYLDVKVLSDYCCASGNATKVIEHVLATHPDVPILFLPDVYLGFYAATLLQDRGESLDRLWLMMGACHVHDMIRPMHVALAREEHPEAAVVYHPECGCTSACMTEVKEGRVSKEQMQARSTQGMVDFVKSAKQKTIIMATEIGNIRPMQLAAPDKLIVPANKDAECAFMKQNTLENLYLALRDKQHVITVDPKVAKRAYIPIERMLAIT